MKLFALLFCVAFLAAAIAAVNEKHANEQKQQQNQAGSSMVAVKPTAAPLTNSTTASTETPKVQVLPTKTLVVKTNSKPHSNTAKPAQKKNQTKSTEKLTTNDSVMENKVKFEVLPIEMPAIDMALIPQKTVDVTPLAITGFITKNGNIYEITDNKGIGKIQGRQVADDTNGEYVCNYGAVIVYSDLPCKQVTSVKISKIEEIPGSNQAPTTQKPQENNSIESNANKESEDKEDLETINKPVKHCPSKTRRNKNKNNKLQTSKKTKKRRNQYSQIRKGNNKRSSNNRRRLQQQKGRNKQSRRRQALEEDYDDDNNHQFQNQHKRNQRKGQRRQQVELYTSDYNDY